MTKMKFRALALVLLSAACSPIDWKSSDSDTVVDNDGFAPPNAPDHYASVGKDGRLGASFPAFFSQRPIDSPVCAGGTLASFYGATASEQQIVAAVTSSDEAVIAVASVMTAPKTPRSFQVSIRSGVAGTVELHFLDAAGALIDRLDVVVVDPDYLVPESTRWSPASGPMVLADVPLAITVAPMRSDKEKQLYGYGGIGFDAGGSVELLPVGAVASAPFGLLQSGDTRVFIGHAGGGTLRASMTKSSVTVPIDVIDPLELTSLMIETKESPSGPPTVIVRVRAGDRDVFGGFCAWQIMPSGATLVGVTAPPDSTEPAPLGLSFGNVTLGPAVSYAPRGASGTYTATCTVGALQTTTQFTIAATAP